VRVENPNLAVTHSLFIPVEEFDREVGLKYLKAWHINDSKAALGSHKDRHENIGWYDCFILRSYSN
jgi:endonuclease IV